MNIQGRESLITQCSWETDIYSTIFLYFPHLRAVLQWCGKGDYFEFMIMKQRNILKGPCQDWGFWYRYRPSSGLAFGYLCILPQTIPSSPQDPFCKFVEITHCRDLLISDHSKRERNCFWVVSTGLPGPGNEQQASQATLHTCSGIWGLRIPNGVILPSMSQWLSGFENWAFILRDEMALICFENQMLGKNICFSQIEVGGFLQAFTCFDL